MKITKTPAIAEIILSNKFIFEQMKRDFTKKKKVITYEKVIVELVPNSNKLDVKA